MHIPQSPPGLASELRTPVGHVYNSSGLEYYRHADWLGSARLTSTPSRTVTGDVAYAPFGETYASSGSPDLSYTGQNPDTNANLYDFMYREYGIQGRWPSPDPLGSGAFNLADPQSLNLYAYVRNTPTSFVDSLGLCGGSGDYPDLPCPIGTLVVVNGGGPGSGPGMGGGGAGNGGSEFGGGGGCTAFLAPASGNCPGPNYGGGALIGPIPPSQAPQNQTSQTAASRASKILSCAQVEADHYSIAGLLGVKKGGLLGTVAYAFGGNSISGLIDVAGHISSGLQAASEGNSQGVAGATLQVQGDLMLGGTLQGVITGGMDNPAAQGLVGTFTEAVFGAVAETVGTVKLGVDAAVFLTAAAYCAENQ
jgi:RHS repeat-associated protein